MPGLQFGGLERDGDLPGGFQIRFPGPAFKFQVSDRSEEFLKRDSCGRTSETNSALEGSQSLLSQAGLGVAFELIHTAEHTDRTAACLPDVFR